MYWDFICQNGKMEGKYSKLSAAEVDRDIAKCLH